MTGSREVVQSAAAAPFIDADDYESLPTHNVYVHLTAGAAAGIMEHTFMFPIDSVKTRMQSLCPCPERTCKTPVSGLLTMMKREGLTRPIRGITAVASLSGPAHALYFTIYDKLKLFLTNGRPGFHHYAYGISGIVATVAHDAVMNPVEVVKQRLQMWGSPFRGCVECARCLWRTEGLCAFYRSYATQLLMNVPFQTVHFISYEAAQHRLNPRRRYDPLSHVAAGALAGGLAAAVTTPLDVCKTALNTQDWRMIVTASAASPCCAPVAVVAQRPAAHCPTAVNGLRDAVRAVYRLRGLAGFFAGLQARMMFQMPSTALSWSVYELFKFLLSEDCDGRAGAGDSNSAAPVDAQQQSREASRRLHDSLCVRV